MTYAVDCSEEAEQVILIGWFTTVSTMGDKYDHL